MTGKLYVLLADMWVEDRSLSVTGVPPKRVKVGDLEEASKVCRKFISKHMLGGSDWAGGEITDEAGNFVGYVSYNGRVWGEMPSESTDASEPIYDPWSPDSGSSIAKI